jgi:two-component system phosphate regulon response regulator PhoB
MPAPDVDTDSSLSRHLPHGTRQIMSGLILVVEDEQDLATTLDYNLRREGYQTRVAATGGEALELAAAEPVPDLVILDLMLPDLSGTEVCRQLRSVERTRAVPVIMLTARGEEIDRVVGFEVGADDYVVKPFSVRELLLRIRAILRRAEPAPAGDGPTAFGILRLDPGGHRAWVDGEEIILTALEFKLLATFLARKGRVQSRETLLADVWGIQADVTTRTVDTHVKRLREKLGAAGGYVETIRGVGYRFRAEPSGES